MRKKLAAVLLALVLVCAMTFPALAALVEADADKWDSYVNGAFALLQTMYPQELQDYPYHMVLIADRSKVVNEPTPNTTELYIIYSKTPVIRVGDTIRMTFLLSIFTYDAQSGVYTYRIDDITGRPTIDKVIFVQDLPAKYTGTLKPAPNMLFNANTVMTSKLGHMFNYFLSDYSTAHFFDQDSFSSYELAFRSVDTSILEALIAQALGIQDTGYSKSTWNALQSGLTAGQNLLTTTGYTQAQVDAAAKILRDVIDGLALLPTAPDLAARIVYAQSIEDIGYTPYTWGNLQSAIVGGQNLLASRDYTQVQLTAADVRIENAITGLQLAASPDPPPDPWPDDDDPNHRYLVDGIRVKDLLPAKEAVFQNLNFGTRNGLILFAILMGLYVALRVLGRFFGHGGPSGGSSREMDLMSGRSGRKFP